ncbi:bacterio-opsin activator domain-containing protein [Halarchaeum acidiphilum MH1-52-1]|uniref:Bacterio-opsin activator domain-containing protein n=1 Tax=Halarchaeum acidiphilum MH1-52-1 TaxID=1261545 RepID=U2YV94_9EURY|nr:bacterio-opsin activator domain-containing protein [Halarchaeum acidiphilum MH1-52-1]
MWVRPISRRYPDVCFRVLAAFPGTADGGIGLVEISGPDLPAVRDAVESSDVLRTVDVLHDGDGGTLVRFETSAPLLLRALRSARVPLELPFEVRDGVANWTLTAARDDLSRLGDELDARGVDYRLERVRDDAGRDPALLTERQHELLELAVERGYYDHPRGATLTELAAEAGVAKSTLSGLLQRAEGRVVKRHLRVP